MVSFIKKLIERRKEELNILLFDENNPHQQETYTIQPGKIFLMIGGINLAVVLIVLFILFITPLGTMVFNKEDRAVRSSVLEITERVNALQDSLQARDNQLAEIQHIIRDGTDTTFNIRSTPEWDEMYGESAPQQNVQTFHVNGLREMQSLQSDQIVFSDIFTGTVAFPAEAPVDGSLTGTYRPGDGHFGIDIAANRGADVRTIADGVVISSNWTFNNGYVVHVLHGDGLISVFKHFSEVYYMKGDAVRKGDTIGKVGETGLLASGPHIHFELWKNGISLDPSNYINLY